MGHLILEQVLGLLRDKGFLVEEAFPGQTAPLVAEPVAAVHIEHVDTAAGQVTVEVSMVSPGALGGASCEKAALDVTEALAGAGGVCIQGGCGYERLSGMYVTSVLATFDCRGTQGSMMSYKTFSWPRNPHTYAEYCVREPAYTEDDAGEAVFSGMGPQKRTITGKGVFLGTGAYADFQNLAALLEDGTAGTLTHPVWGQRNAYFTSLELTQEARENAVSYRFEFQEADDTGAIPK